MCIFTNKMLKKMAKEICKAINGFEKFGKFYVIS